MPPIFVICVTFFFHIRIHRIKYWKSNYSSPTLESSMVTLIRPIIRPMICYGALVWWPRCDLAAAQKQLSKIQRLALSVTSAFCRYNTNGSTRSHAKLKLSSHLIMGHNNGHTKLWTNITRIHPELNIPCDSTPPDLSIDL